MATKFKYIGEDERNLAGVGDLKPGQVFSCSNEQGVQIQKHSPEIYTLVADETPVSPAKAKKAEPAPAAAPEPAK